MTDAPALGRPRSTLADWRAVYLHAADHVGLALGSGFVVGLIVGGVGGRLAMLLLRLTSDPALRGRETDDGFIIGEVTGDSVFLLVAGALVGALGGLVYLGLREWLPLRWRAPVIVLLAVTTLGALIIRPDGIDFTLLEPLGLAVAMFLVLPAAGALALVWLVERSAAAAPSRRREAVGAVLLVLLLLAFGVLGVVLLALALLLIAVNRGGRVAALWRSRPTTLLGRAAIAALVAFAGVELVRDVAAVL